MQWPPVGRRACPQRDLASAAATHLLRTESSHRGRCQVPPLLPRRLFGEFAGAEQSCNKRKNVGKLKLEESNRQNVLSIILILTINGRCAPKCLSAALNEQAKCVS